MKKTRETSDNLTLYLNDREREDQAKPKVSKRKKIIKITVEINGIDTKKTIHIFNETKRCFFEKARKMDKLVGTLT